MSTSQKSPYVDARLYDVVFSWHDQDLDLYVQTAKRSRGPVLEAACGTGRVLIPTLEAGVDIDGFDLEPTMLEVLRHKAAARGLAPRVVVADMRDFTMPRRYALITIPFRAFAHLLTSEDQIRALLCIREHLEPGGSLVFNVFYPSFRYMAERDGKRVLDREFPHPEHGLPVALYDTTSYDPVAQLLTVEREVIESDARGYIGKTHRYGFTLRWTYRFEMELLLRSAGYSRWEVWGGYDGRPLENESDEMVWTAWKD